MCSETETCFFDPLKVIVHPKFNLSSFTHLSSSFTYSTKQLMAPIDCHWRKKRSMGAINCFVKNILQKIVFCALLL